MAQRASERLVNMELPKTLSELARRVGCEGYPERWEALYPGCLADFQKNGCVFTDPEYYAGLHHRYGIFKEFLPLYQEAAIAVGKDSALALFLSVLCRALQDREHHKADMKAFKRPKHGNDFAVNMVCALAAASEAPMCHELLTSRGIPKTVLESVMNSPEFGVRFYQLRHNGKPGYNLLDWFQLSIDGKLFRLGRLEYEIFNTFKGRVCVFENAYGERIALAHDIPLHRSGLALGSAGCTDPEGSYEALVQESETAYTGHPVQADGSVDNFEIVLPKNAWNKILSYGDPVISVHIPAGGGLTEEAVDDSITQAKQFFSKYFPDFEYRAFVCYSWLMDPQLVDLLGTDTNIAKFNLRFSKMTCKSAAEAVFSFIYLLPEAPSDYATLPQRTTLERKLKEHYLAGNYIYEQVGYFF